MNVPLNKGKQFWFFFSTRELTEFLDGLNTQYKRNRWIEDDTEFLSWVIGRMELPLFDVMTKEKQIWQLREGTCFFDLLS